MRFAVLTGILVLVVVQYPGAGAENMENLYSYCRVLAPVTPCGEHGWFRFDYGHCIKVYREIRSRSSARDFCGTIGGALVSIHSHEEHDKLLCLVARDYTTRCHYWIGAQRDVSGDRNYFKWDDGKMMTYSRWIEQQPDDARGSENCVELNYKRWGGWNDVNCCHKNRFVCVKKM